MSEGKKWYSLRVISGKERKIKERIELEIKRAGWDDVVTQVLVPSEKVYKIRNGKKVILDRNILPGYILLEADPERFSAEIVQGISNMPNVIHFLGRQSPIPMQESEANRMLGKVDDSQGLVESMVEKKKLKVIVKIFGRGTEVELNFMQVEKTS
jgi:transcription termination/antitermination protein NusG